MQPSIFLADFRPFSREWAKMNKNLREKVICAHFGEWSQAATGIV